MSRQPQWLTSCGLFQAAENFQSSEQPCEPPLPLLVAATVLICVALFGGSGGGGGVGLGRHLKL